MSCPTCALRGPHFRCLGFGCGLHVLSDDKPCPSCRYFRFEPVSVDEPIVAAPTLEPVTPPAAASKQAKRRPRGAADSTQRN